MRCILVLVVGFLAVGCGPYSRTEARNLAAERTCNFYEDCEAYGPGEQYEDRDECILSSRNFWNDSWPTGECSSIQRENLEVCLDAIHPGTVCDNALDWLNTLFNKCGRAQVCAEPTQT